MNTIRQSRERNPSRAQSVIQAAVRNEMGGPFRWLRENRLCRRRRGRALWIRILFLGAVVSLPLQLGASGSNDSSLLKKIRMAGEYKRLYGEVRDTYEDSHARYQEMRRDLNETRELILLHRGNEEDLQELIRRRREAWGRLYRVEDHSQASQTNLKPASGSGGYVEPNADIDIGEIEFPAGNRIVPLWSRYRCWKDRYESIREAFDLLENALESLEEELRVVREELDRMEGGAADARSLLETKMDAWRRIYRD